MTSLTAPTQSRGIRAAIALVGIALTYVVALSFYKSSLMQEVAQQGAQSLPPRHAQVTGLFQASFYFFYEDQFLPGIGQVLSAETYPKVERLRVISSDAPSAKGASVLFDSDRPRKPAEGGAETLRLEEPRVLAAIAATAKSKGTRASPEVFYNGFRIEALMPGPKYSVLYTFDASQVRNRVLIALILGFLLLFGARGLLSSRLALQMGDKGLRWWKDFWRLRIKFLAAIVLINLLTAAIVFYSLTSLQTRSQTERIQRESLLFSQFSTAQVISNFTSFFYSRYSDRFIPETKKIIASNENLLGMRILSCRTGGVLFDSEQADIAPQLGGLDNAKADFPAEIQKQLQARDLATRLTEREGEPLLLVVNTFRNEQQEPAFWVEYRYSFQSLVASIQAIRRQILFDLIPSLALGLLIAAVFAQLLIAPIRKLMGALGRVSRGDYEAHVDFAHARGDEIGDLGLAFNAMTEELRKKKELRKYLSDSTYRQVMRASDSPGGLKLGGSRVSATILFSDIRNFVGHCESLEAEEVTAMLNEYFSEMVEIVYKHGGEIDKFIGDALLAVFYAADESRTITPDGSQGAGQGVSQGLGGAPSASGTSLQAMYCALEMRERLKEFNQRRRTAGKPEIDTGVGISHGEIISGPIGAKDRMDFTVIGDVVNLASRIEKLSKRGRHTKIVFSQQIQEMVRDLLDYEELGVERVAGKEESVRVYELVGIKQIEALVSHLSSTDLALRRRSVELLGHSRNSDALPHLISRFGDPDELTRLQAVLAAARLAVPGEGTSSLFDAFVGCLTHEKSEKVLSALIAAIGRLSAPAAGRPAGDLQVQRLISALGPYLDSPNERIVANAIEALGQARDPRCTDLILPKLASRHNRVKANAAMALFGAGRIEVIDTLKPMLMHSDPLMRSSAAFAIGELTVIAGQDQLISYWKSQAPVLKLFLAELQECVPMLVACLRDPEVAVRRQAIIALGKIKDKSAVLPMIDLLDPARGGKELLADISQALASIGSHRLVREVIARLSST